tara:strand:- start:403 stop:504 length:102 start_codon:yes stop_codon:yes gene_type:complete
MEVIWTAIKGILIGLGMIIVIKFFGWDKKDDDE